ncbi:uncharacterized protein LOC100277939 [Zea mays]|jgi:hypothetical protein|uniref:Uncharacterized protein n=1 Tax=Zea mays TaxID=4577 RepID=B4FYT4_MAIZE|nr:uncharacterized protein LOC100277939 [Zea mays]ACF87277.1 unknown [Zea mays]ACG43410.1 hypothetical protein [Zea mays]ONM30730.1 hypothetical protein ZEAMMB73_Zm00001d040172 [Zea mays]|eukprot:NP_001144851.1 uncharacterized protein LOC100277939 [Zea mays]
MRAITGGVVSSQPCPLHKAALFLKRFTESAASHLPSSDCCNYLRNAADATTQLSRFRKELGGSHKQGAANSDAHYYDDPVKGNRNHEDQESKGDMAIAADDSNRDSAAEAKLDVASGKKGNKKKNGDPLEDRAVARANSHIPPSPEIATEKRKKNHPNKEIIVDVKQEPNSHILPSPEIATEKSKKKSRPNKEIIVDVKQEPSFVVEEELVSEKKSKKKKEKDHVKLEENVNEVEEKIVNDSAAEQRVAITERERKKKKHKQEECTEVVKEKKITDGDLDREKKRKKKRDRGDNYDNAPEQVEHINKKQKKHLGIS